MGAIELDAISAEGAALDLAPGAGLEAPAPPPPAGPSEAEKIAMWAGIPATFGAVMAMAMPELAAVYSPDACHAWGVAMLPVAKKHGWDNLDNLPELALALVSLPFAIGTVLAIKKRRQPAAVKGAPGATPNVQTVGPNAGVV